MQGMIESLPLILWDWKTHFMVTYQEFKPHPILDESVKCFWALSREYNAEQPTEEVLPDSYYELILHFGARYSMQEGEAKRNLPGTFLIGLLKQPLPLYANGTVRLVAARCFPWAIFDFLNGERTQDITTNLTLALADNLQQSIAQHLHEHRFSEAVESLEQFFLERYIDRNFDRDTVNAAAQMIYQQRGICRIEDLADACHMTERTLQRNFQQRLGLSPKSYAGNVRFDRIKKKLERNPDINLTELAYEFGYFDQAHFSKDFKRYCQMTPVEFTTRIQQMQELLSGNHNVVFLQAPDAVD